MLARNRSATYPALLKRGMICYRPVAERLNLPALEFPEARNGDDAWEQYVQSCHEKSTEVVCRVLRRFLAADVVNWVQAFLLENVPDHRLGEPAREED